MASEEMIEKTAEKAVTRRQIVDNYNALLALTSEKVLKCLGCAVPLHISIEWGTDDDPRNTRLVMECWSCSDRIYA